MQQIKIWPYFGPVLFTLVFILSQYLGWILLPIIVLVCISVLSTRLGTFSGEKLLIYYKYFHEDSGFQFAKIGMAFFFIVYNLWILIYLSFNILNVYNLVFFVFVNLIINSGFLLSLAHDLMHATTKLGRTTSRILLGLNGYFYLEMDHLMIHHHSVGTDEDPASAKLGQSIYAYLPYSITRRLQYIFSRKIKSRALKLNMMGIGLISMIYLLLSSWASPQALIVTLIQFIGSILIYETVTYIQHYGLRKTVMKSGALQKTNNNHAWNSYNIVNNFMYFFMPVHSHHHTGLGPAVHPLDLDGPAMPLSFPVMLVLPYIPNLWFDKMDPLVRQNSTP